MENYENGQRLIRFPAKEITPQVYQCPCGRGGLKYTRVYTTGLDDADPDWGRGDDKYYFDYRDPCSQKYEVLYLDEETREFVLRVPEE